MHPVSGIKKQYASAWAITSMVYALVLYYFYDQEFITSVTESILFTLFYFGTGISYWFVVRYNPPQKSNYLRLITTHLISVALLLFLIVFGVSAMLDFIFVEKSEYLEFYHANISWRIISGLSFFIIIILFYYLSLYYGQIEESRSRELKLQGLVKEAELETLKSQINPHFIFNSLNSINTLIHISPEKASEMLVKLSQFLRFSLSKQSHEFNRLEDELSNVQRYLDIEKIRFEEKLNLYYSIGKDTARCTIPSLILQPLLENAIKFGVYENMKESSIQISTEKKSGFLNVMISNNFESGNTFKKGSGIGLKNVEERLRLLYHQSGLLRTHKTKDQFTVEINIPQV